MTDKIFNSQLITLPSSSKKKNLVCMSVKVLGTKKETREILPEEQYVQNLEKIIVRDYFPELPKLKAQSEYLEAVGRNDHVKIRELQIRYSTRRRTDRKTSPSARRSSPSVFDPDSPGSSILIKSPYANKDGDNEAFLNKKKKNSVIDNHTVESYLDKYTSEDNASFEELAQLHNKREKVRNAWMYEAEQNHNESLVYRSSKPIAAADEQLLAIRNGKVEKPAALDNWTYKARNTVLFNIDEAPLTISEYVERTKQNQKVINKNATRLNQDFVQKPQQTLMARVALQQASNNAGHVDVTGKEIGVVNNSALKVLATPSPAPGMADSPLMTWGEIDGTPFRLDAPDILPAMDNAPTFKIPDLPMRERVAQVMADQIAKRYHGKRKHAVNHIQKAAPKTPSFNSSKSSGKLALMSPAARRFATDKLGVRISTDKIKLCSPISNGSTPKSSRLLYSPAFYKIIKIKKETLSTPGTSAESSFTKASMTDNLFNLPPSPIPQSLQQSEVKRTINRETLPLKKLLRPRAADFF